MTNNYNNRSAILTTLIDLLYTLQQTDGSFESVSIDKSNSSQPSNNIFITSSVLCCLEHCATEEKVVEIAKRSVDFLLNEKSADWTWNYWQHTSREYTERNYPDDLDDTFVALTAIAAHCSSFIDTEVMLASMTKTLTNTERAGGGPYNTWIIDIKKDTRFEDVDIVVNANIQYFLGKLGIYLESIDTLTEQALSSENVTSNYYTDPLVVLYFILKSYRGKKKNEFKDHLKKIYFEKELKTPLKLSLFVTSMLNFGASQAEVEKEIGQLISFAEEKVFEPEPFYLEENKTIKKYCGSKSLTIALCLEALLLYKNTFTNEELLTKQKNVSDEKAHRIHLNAIVSVEHFCSLFPFSVYQKLKRLIDALLKKDSSKQITLLPYYFYKSLNIQHKIFEETCTAMASAGLGGWLAYRIYDDIIDNEGDVSLLPAANVLARTITEIYAKILPIDQYHFFERIMNNMEIANTWEKVHCFFAKNQVVKKAMLPHYADYAYLADKSKPHALGPLCQLILAGFTPDSEEVKNTYHFFQNYLIAKQLNDDAHDWQDDLSRGFVNSIGSSLLLLYMEKHTAKQYSLISKNLLALRELFWEEHIDNVAARITKHISFSRASLKKMTFMKETSYFENMLVPLEKATAKALAERNFALTFISAYTNLHA